MADPIPVCDLAEALAAQEIEAGVFLPFAIRCLQAGDSQVTERQLSVRILQREGSEHTENLRVQWSPAHIPTLPPAVQSHIITEWGALGVACAVLHGLGDGLRLTSVAREGDRFDYWVGNDEQEWGLYDNEQHETGCAYRRDAGARAEQVWPSAPWPLGKRAGPAR